MTVTASPELIEEMTEMIIDACHVEDIEAGDVDPDMPLIGPDSPLGLDSLDAVEIVVSVQKTYDVRIGGQESSRELLASLRVLADYVARERA